MAELNRRRFLQIAGATASLTALSDSIARAAAIPAARRTGTLADVEHIVVLMQENRSFDHYFGSMKGVRGLGDPRPITLDSGKPVWYQSDGGKDVLPYHPADSGLGMRCIEGLDHGWAGGHRAWNQGKADQWIPAKTARTMAYLTREDIPFHYALADAFTVCDAYHCSLNGPTDPNRYYMYTGYVGNDGKGGGPVIGNEEAGYGWTTYPERLEKAGVSWKFYQDIGDGLDKAGKWGWIDDPYRGNYGDNSLLYFTSYRDAKPGQPLYDKARTGTNAKKGDGYFDVLTADVKAGKLPKISWIAAPEAFCEHPNWPPNYGAWYISRVLEALTSNPDVWSKTVLLITYDENDGFFDHVPQPFPPSSADRGLSTVATTGEQYPGSPGNPAGPYGLGQRVPMLVVSPWSTGGFVCSEVFDHTSILRLMETRFGVREPNISPWRRAVCGDLTAAFDFTLQHPAKPSLPSTAAYEPHGKPPAEPVYRSTPPAHPVLPKQESGSKHTRPLRYAPWTDVVVSPSIGGLTLTFGGGPAGVCFHVRSGNRKDGPWTYTTEAGKTIADTWHTGGQQGKYDLTVHGPNGFLRGFAGYTTAAGPEITARHRPANDAVELVMTNTGTAECRLSLTESYRGRKATFTVKPGQTVSHTEPLGANHHWYDITVTSSTDKAFLRRFAGHVENGKPGTSDPAIVTR
ncbi:phosphocholine-specific phospholipase C [Amycolatopsis sp. NPDC059021]|uniref:phosphocholine-specific phospholipase C n=1 Tax=Amycolatopsis sp. NPDC059021 TaxID=3346704 RepID=UPI003670DC2F